jgi:hypothetical protein
MRLSYYRFPENINAHTRYLNGADNINGDCGERDPFCRCGLAKHWPDMNRLNASKCRIDVLEKQKSEFEED